MKKRFGSFFSDEGPIKRGGKGKGGEKRRREFMERANQMEENQKIIANNAQLLEYYSRFVAGVMAPSKFFPISRKAARETILLAIEQTKEFARRNNIPWGKKE